MVTLVTFLDDDVWLKVQAVWLLTSPDITGRRKTRSEAAIRVATLMNLAPPPMEKSVGSILVTEEGPVERAFQVDRIMLKVPARICMAMVARRR